MIWRGSSHRVSMDKVFPKDAMVDGIRLTKSKGGYQLLTHQGPYKVTHVGGWYPALVAFSSIS